jgi:hypothetical protein
MEVDEAVLFGTLRINIQRLKERANHANTKA